MKILYIKPRGYKKLIEDNSQEEFQPSTIPSGLVGLANLAIENGHSVFGGYYDHSDLESGIKKADLIMIDIHWYIYLFGAFNLIRCVRSVKPDAKILVGGGIQRQFFTGW